jgi:hypothetical protein
MSSSEELSPLGIWKFLSGFQKTLMFLWFIFSNFYRLFSSWLTIIPFLILKYYLSKGE